MKKLINTTFRKFYEINEFVARTSPMRTHYSSGNPVEKMIWQSKLQTVRKLLRMVPYQTVLDVGCGDGGLLATVKPESDYTGIDISPTQLAFFRSIVPNLQKHRAGTISMKRGNALRLPFKPNTFDLVLACDVLEHVLRPYKVIQNIHDVLKHKGYALISIPNEPVWQLLRLLSLRFPPRSPDHLFSIEENDITNIFPSVISRRYLPLPIPPLHFFEILLVQKLE